MPLKCIVHFVHHRAFAVPDDDAAFEAAASELMPDGESRVWNNAVMELGGVACGKTPTCDESGCPWRRFCHAYETGDFTAPDVPTQPSFEGSRRQFRGRVVRVLGEYDDLGLSELGPRVRVDYGGDTGAEWLRDLVDDLESDGLVDVAEGDDGVRVDYGGDTGAEWLRDLVDDLESDGLVDVAEGDDGVRVSLAK
ncbi:A/G-specific adenine glycosylase [Haloferax sp. ATCC BAA-645]|nr:A/G-specific adenine glycosylase [Haloferax sp. ATCC BAA-645]